MKKIFTYFGLVLSIALAGVFTACNPKEIDQNVEAGLAIKAFFPTKVVAGQPMTINGPGMSDVREVVFPDGVTVSAIEHVGNDMLRVVAPAGIASAGGKLIVRTADDQAESKSDLTLGHTVVSGFSKQDGEEIGGGEQFTIFGTDLEFISRVELIDPDGNPLILEDEDFYRKGTSNVVITIPRKIFDGTWKGKFYTIDGREFELPELIYTSASDGGHWETVKTVVWTNPDPEGNGAVNWNGKYRFCLEGMDTNSECIAEFPADVWEKIKTGTFFIRLTKDPNWYQIRITNGHWSVQWQGADKDFQPGQMDDRVIDNGDGTFHIEINFGNDPLVETLDEKHLLLTGSAWTPLELYFEEEVWVDGGDSGPKEVDFWTNPDPDGNGAVNWNGKYRFCLEGMDFNNECIAEFPADVWEKIKKGTFYVCFTKDPNWYQVRITNGHWSVQWQGADKDFQPGQMDDRVIDNGDGTFHIEINFGNDPLVETLDEKHLLLTGSAWTPLELYFEEEVWVDGGDSGPKEVDFWTNPDPDGNGAVNWNGKYRFCLEGMDFNNECIAEFPADVWEKIKKGTFYVCFTKDPNWYQVRITNGHWSVQWQGADKDFQPGQMDDRVIDNGDGTFHIEINFGNDPLVETLDEKHLLLTGSAWTPLKLYFIE